MVRILEDIHSHLLFAKNKSLSKFGLKKPEYKGQSTSQWNAIVPASYLKIRYFFILQSLTTSKMRKFHKANTCWTENWWSSGIMSNFLEAKKSLNFFQKHCSIRTKKLHNMILANQKQAINSQSIVYCSTRNTFLRYFYIMNLSKHQNIKGVPITGTGKIIQDYPRLQEV